MPRRDYLDFVMSEEKPLYNPMTTYNYSGTELELFKKAHNWKRYCHSILQPYLRGRVLEVGAGIGGTTAVLCDGSQALWLCLEPDAALSNQLNNKIDTGRLPRCCRALNGDITSVPIDSEFDAILYIDVLEHLEDDRKQLAQAAERLAKGGALIVVSPALPWLFSSFDRAIGHFRRYTKTTLRRTAPSGLQLVLVRYLDSLGIIPSLGNRIFLRRSVPSEWQIILWDQVLVRFSRRLDPLLRFAFGKSIVAIWYR